MERFIIVDDFCYSTNCDLCSRKGQCDSEIDCIRELMERLFKFEESASIAEQKIMANPFLSNLYEKMKGD